jgi:hypothetical protein
LHSLTDTLDGCIGGGAPTANGVSLLILILFWFFTYLNELYKAQKSEVAC